MMPARRHLASAAQRTLVSFADAIAALSCDPAPRGRHGSEDDPVHGWDSDAAGDAIDWLATQPLSPDQVAALAAALDQRPARWARDGELALRAWDLLAAGDWSRLPRFLIVASEEDYTSETDGGSFLDDDDDDDADDDDDDGPNPLMQRRRVLEASLLERAIDAMRHTDDRDARARLFAAALDAPERVGSDSAAHMAAQILDRLASRAPASFGWLCDLIATETADGPYGWAVSGLAHRQRQLQQEALRRLHRLFTEQDWEELVTEASAVIEAYPDRHEPHVFLTVAHRWLEQLDDAEAAARRGLALVPGSLAILDAALPPMLHNGRADAAIALWQELRPRLLDAAFDGDPDRARARLHIERCTGPLRAVLDSVVGNVIVAYCTGKRVDDGIRDLVGYIDALDGPLLLGNAACMFALAGDVDAALGAVERALEAGKPVGFFERDGDLDSLRAMPAFQALLETARDAAEDSDTEDSEDDDREDDDREDEDGEGSDDRQAAVDAIRAQLASREVDTIRAGLRALRAWVTEAGSEPDLSRFGVEPGEEELVASEPFDAIVERHGLALGTDSLLDLVASLFNSNVEYHSTRAAITAARLLVATDDVAVHHALVEIFQRGLEYYDDGHRYHGESGLDLFIDEILAACSGPPLARLMIWAYEHHYTQDLGDLLAPALASNLATDDEDQVLTAFERSLRDDDGSLYTYEMEAALGRIQACLDRPTLSATARARLEVLRAEAQAEQTMYETIRRLLRTELATDLHQLLAAVGTTIAADRVERESTTVSIELARHYPDLRIEVLLDALGHFGGDDELFAHLLRLAVELDPYATVERVARLSDDRGAAASDALRRGIERGNDPALFTSLRRTLRLRDLWTELPRAGHPALTELLDRARSRPAARST
jgi:hypothetical protein